MGDLCTKRTISFNRVTALIVLVAFCATHLYSPSLQANETADTVAPAFSSLPAVTEIKIPKEIGHIEKIHSGKSTNTVILIQDAHAIPDAQKSIHHTIAHFEKHYGVRRVALEGSSGDLDSTLLKSYPDQKQLQKVLESYHEKGEIPGGTAAAIFSEFDTQFVGIENWDVFEKGLIDYQQALKISAENQKWLDAEKQKLRESKKTIYPPQLFEIDQAIEAFYANRLSFPELWQKLIAIKSPDSKSPLFILTQKNPDQNHVDALRHFRGTELVQAFEKYIREMKVGLMVNDAQRDLDRESQNLARMQRLNQLELTPGDWNPTSAIDAHFVDRGRWAHHLAFYASVKQRDLIFVQNLEKLFSTSSLRGRISKMAEAIPVLSTKGRPRHSSEIASPSARNDVAIMVAGGFHTEGLIAEFEKRGYSYILIMPQMDSVPDSINYRDHMQGNVSFKDYFQVENGKISPYKAFVRSVRDKLAYSVERIGDRNTKESKDFLNATRYPLNANLLKPWRDNIIRNLIKTEKVQDAWRYTQFIDETLKESSLTPWQQEWMTNINQFLEGMQQLDQKGQLNQSTLAQLFKPVSTSGDLTYSLAAPGTWYAASTLRTGGKEKISGDVDVSVDSDRISQQRSQKVALNKLSQSPDSQEILSRLSGDFQSFDSGLVIGEDDKKSVQAGFHLTNFIGQSINSMRQKLLAFAKNAELAAQVFKNNFKLAFAGIIGIAGEFFNHARKLADHSGIVNSFFSIFLLKNNHLNPSAVPSSRSEMRTVDREQLRQSLRIVLSGWDQGLSEGDEQALTQSVIGYFRDRSAEIQKLMRVGEETLNLMLDEIRPDGLMTEWLNKKVETFFLLCDVVSAIVLSHLELANLGGAVFDALPTVADHKLRTDIEEMKRRLRLDPGNVYLTLSSETLRTIIFGRDESREMLKGVPGVKEDGILILRKPLDQKPRLYVATYGAMLTGLLEEPASVEPQFLSKGNQNRQTQIITEWRELLNQAKAKFSPDDFKTKVLDVAPTLDELRSIVKAERSEMRYQEHDTELYHQQILGRLKKFEADINRLEQAFKTGGRLPDHQIEEHLERINEEDNLSWLDYWTELLEKSASADMYHAAQEFFEVLFKAYTLSFRHRLLKERLQPAVAGALTGGFELTNKILTNATRTRHGMLPSGSTWTSVEEEKRLFEKYTLSDEQIIERIELMLKLSRRTELLLFDLQDAPTFEKAKIASRLLLILKCTSLMLHAFGELKDFFKKTELLANFEAALQIIDHDSFKQMLAFLKENRVDNELTRLHYSMLANLAETSDHFSQLLQRDSSVEQTKLSPSIRSAMLSYSQQLNTAIQPHSKDDSRVKEGVEALRKSLKTLDAELQNTRIKADDFRSEMRISLPYKTIGGRKLFLTRQLEKINTGDYVSIKLHITSDFSSAGIQISFLIKNRTVFLTRFTAHGTKYTAFTDSDFFQHHDREIYKAVAAEFFDYVSTNNLSIEADPLENLILGNLVDGIAQAPFREAQQEYENKKKQIEEQLKPVSDLSAKYQREKSWNVISFALLAAATGITAYLLSPDIEPKITLAIGGAIGLGVFLILYLHSRFSSPRSELRVSKAKKGEMVKKFLAQDKDILRGLSYRERETLKLLHNVGTQDAGEYSYQEVADIFNVTPMTVRNIESRAIAKLNRIHNQRSETRIKKSVPSRSEMRFDATFESTNIQFKRGYDLFHAEDYAAAIPYFEGVLRFVDVANVHLFLGVSLFRVGQKEKAIEHFNLAYARSPAGSEEKNTAQEWLIELTGQDRPQRYSSKELGLALLHAALGVEPLVMAEDADSIGLGPHITMEALIYLTELEHLGYFDEFLQFLFEAEKIALLAQFRFPNLSHSQLAEKLGMDLSTFQENLEAAFGATADSYDENKDDHEKELNLLWHDFTKATTLDNDQKLPSLRELLVIHYQNYLSTDDDPKRLEALNAAMQVGERFEMARQYAQENAKQDPVFASLFEKFSDYSPTDNRSEMRLVFNLLKNSWVMAGDDIAIGVLDWNVHFAELKIVVPQNTTFSSHGLYRQDRGEHFDELYYRLKIHRGREQVKREDTAVLNLSNVQLSIAINASGEIWRRGRMGVSIQTQPEQIPLYSHGEYFSNLFANDQVRIEKKISDDQFELSYSLRRDSVTERRHFTLIKRRGLIIKFNDQKNSGFIHSNSIFYRTIEEGLARLSRSELREATEAEQPRIFVARSAPFTHPDLLERLEGTAEFAENLPSGGDVRANLQNTDGLIINLGRFQDGMINKQSKWHKDYQKIKRYLEAGQRRLKFLILYWPSTPEHTVDGWLRAKSKIFAGIPTVIIPESLIYFPSHTMMTFHSTHTGMGHIRVELAPIKNGPFTRSELRVRPPLRLAEPTKNALLMWLSQLRYQSKFKTQIIELGKDYPHAVARHIAWYLGGELSEQYEALLDELTTDPAAAKQVGGVLVGIFIAEQKDYFNPEFVEKRKAVAQKLILQIAKKGPEYARAVTNSLVPALRNLEARSVIKQILLEICQIDHESCRIVAAHLAGIVTELERGEIAVETLLEAEKINSSSTLLSLIRTLIYSEGEKAAKLENIILRIAAQDEERKIRALRYLRNTQKPHPSIEKLIGVISPDSGTRSEMRGSDIKELVQKELELDSGANGESLIQILRNAEQNVMNSDRGVEVLDEVPEVLEAHLDTVSALLSFNLKDNLWQIRKILDGAMRIFKHYHDLPGLENFVARLVNAHSKLANALLERKTRGDVDRAAQLIETEFELFTTNSSAPGVHSLAERLIKNHTQLAVSLLNRQRKGDLERAKIYLGAADWIFEENKNDDTIEIKLKILEQAKWLVLHYGKLARSNLAPKVKGREKREPTEEELTTAEWALRRAFQIWEENKDFIYVRYDDIRTFRETARSLNVPLPDFAVPKPSSGDPLRSELRMDDTVLEEIFQEIIAGQARDHLSINTIQALERIGSSLKSKLPRPPIDQEQGAELQRINRILEAHGQPIDEPEIMDQLIEKVGDYVWPDPAHSITFGNVRVMVKTEGNKISFNLDDGKGWIEFVASNQPIRVGRKSNNDVVLESSKVSRVHAEFAYKNGAWWIIDLGSKNGTLIGKTFILRAKTGWFPLPVNWRSEMRETLIEIGLQALLSPENFDHFLDAAGKKFAWKNLTREELNAVREVLSHRDLLHEEVQQRQFLTVVIQWIEKHTQRLPEIRGRYRDEYVRHQESWNTDFEIGPKSPSRDSRSELRLNFNPELTEAAAIRAAAIALAPQSKTVRININATLLVTLIQQYDANKINFAQMLRDQVLTAKELAHLQALNQLDAKMDKVIHGGSIGLSVPEIPMASMPDYLNGFLSGLDSELVKALLKDGDLPVEFEKQVATRIGTYPREINPRKMVVLEQNQAYLPMALLGHGYKNLYSEILPLQIEDLQAVAKNTESAEWLGKLTSRALIHLLDLSQDLSLKTNPEALKKELLLRLGLEGYTDLVNIAQAGNQFTISINARVAQIAYENRIQEIIAAMA